MGRNGPRIMEKAEKSRILGQSMWDLQAHYSSQTSKVQQENDSATVRRIQGMFPNV